MKHPFSHHLSVAMTASVVLFAGAGCNLAFDTDDHPYVLVISDESPDAEPANNVAADGGDTSDVAEAGEPRLVITELLIDTDDQGSFGENGEYVEIKNVGTAPADPVNVFLVVTNLDEVSADPATIVVAPPTSEARLRARNELDMIEPGEYFVFVRYETPQVPLTDLVGSAKFYDFGKFSDFPPSLTNRGQRQIELRYTDGEQFYSFDDVRWRSDQLLPPGGGDEPSLQYASNVAVGVDAASETSGSNDSPDVWCLHDNRMAGGNTYLGSPGAPNHCTMQMQE